MKPSLLPLTLACLAANLLVLWLLLGCPGYMWDALAEVVS